MPRIETAADDRWTTRSREGWGRTEQEETGSLRQRLRETRSPCFLDVEGMLPLNVKPLSNVGSEKTLEPTQTKVHYNI